MKVQADLVYQTLEDKGGVMNGLNENILAKGKLDVTLKKANGNIEKETIGNLVVTVGRNHIADQLADQSEAAMSHMAIGEGTTTQIVGDTGLESEVSRKVFTSKTQGSGSDANKVIFVADWAAGEGTGAITEAGIFNAVSAGTMLTRTTFAVKNKEVGDSLSIQWTLTISG